MNRNYFFTVPTLKRTAFHKKEDFVQPYKARGCLSAGNLIALVVLTTQPTHIVY